MAIAAFVLSIIAVMWNIGREALPPSVKYKLKRVFWGEKNMPSPEYVTWRPRRRD